MRESIVALPMTFSAEYATIREAMAAVQAGSGSVGLAIDAGGCLVGLVTDGDLRRALLTGAAMDDPVGPVLRSDPVCVRPDESRTNVLDLMHARGITQMPVVGEQGELLGIHLLKELLGREPRPNVALVLAGGLGTRLLPPSSKVPKPMVSVAGRPILERIVTHLVGYGMQDIVLSVSHLAEVIEAHFGDGSDFGCSITYLKESVEQPLGTGGPLALLHAQRPELREPVVVMNGDLITQFDLADLLDQHANLGASITVGTHTYAYEIPFGVLETDERGLLRSIAEKPVRSELVNAGIYALEPSVLDHVPSGRPVLMTQVITDAIERGEKVRVWACDPEWVDIGHPQDLARARGADLREAPSP